jgi:murein endopeptidase
VTVRRLALALVTLAAWPGLSCPEREQPPPSRALGRPWDGRLAGGRLLPDRGAGFVTWDPIRKRIPNRDWRRWGTARLVRTLERVLAAYARRHPGAAPVLVGDLSRRHGGDFGPRFGGIGHASHQNGLDADVYYPRRDGMPRAARAPRQVERAAAQELVDAFVGAGAVKVFTGPSLGLAGPAGTVQALVHHDDHLHVRLRADYQR